MLRAVAFSSLLLEPLINVGVLEERLYPCTVHKRFDPRGHVPVGPAAHPARDAGDRRPLRLERVHGFIDGDLAGMPGRRRGLGAPTPSPVHGRDGDRALSWGQHYRRADRGHLERRPVVQ